jgi:hypothetical protein
MIRELNSLTPAHTHSAFLIEMVLSEIKYNHK